MATVTSLLLLSSCGGGEGGASARVDALGAGPVAQWLADHGYDPGAPSVPAGGGAQNLATPDDEAHLGTVAVSSALQRVDGGLARAELTATSRDAAGADSLQALADELCAPHGGAGYETPSPLGTPEPGVEWDPVITTTGGCTGPDAGAMVTVVYERSSSKTHDFTELKVVVE